MKKILLIALAIIVTGGLVAFMVYKQQSGYTKVLTAKLVKQDLATVVSGTGQIKPTTIVNVGANVMGRVTHFYVKEGDKVKKGQTVATIENVQQAANVAGQEAAISARVPQSRSRTETSRLGARPGPLCRRHHGQAGLRRQESRLRH
jgi:HlyD family secretion protein